MIADERLEEFLSAQGVVWDIIPAERHIRFCHEWEDAYGSWFGELFRHKEGAKAEEEYSRQVAPIFCIVPFLGPKAGPHSIGGNWRPKTAAYQCRGDGTLPDLSAFAERDLFVAPPDLSWTMVHTHEDHALGGPYFVRREWLVPPIRKRG